jgi:hypothetical protein
LRGLAFFTDGPTTPGGGTGRATGAGIVVGAGCLGRMAVGAPEWPGGMEDIRAAAVGEQSTPEDGKRLSTSYRRRP